MYIYAGILTAALYRQQYTITILRHVASIRANFSWKMGTYSLTIYYHCRAILVN